MIPTPPRPECPRCHWPRVTTPGEGDTIPVRPLRQVLEEALAALPTTDRSGWVRMRQVTEPARVLITEALASLDREEPARAATLEAALREYGQHKVTCQVTTGVVLVVWDCPRCAMPHQAHAGVRAYCSRCGHSAVVGGQPACTCGFSALSSSSSSGKEEG